MQEAEIKALLNKYINNSCTPEELSMLLPYLERPEVKLEIERLLLEEWDTFEPIAAEAGLSENWYERITAANKKKSDSFIHLFRASWIRYAAIILMVLGISFIFFKQSSNTTTSQQVAMIEAANPKGQRSVVTLPDSSIVTLGADSRLQYPSAFNGNKREVRLQGEAFFEVKHKSHEPFIVRTGEVQTQVLGTSFKIEAFKDQQLRVSVATGKVSVGYQKAGSPVTSLAILTPGQMVSWNPIDKVSKTGMLAVDDILDLKNGRLAFTDARLDAITMKLERWYNIRIIIKDEVIKAYTMSLSINGQQSVTNALDAITAAAHISYSLKNDQIKLYK